MGRKSSSKDQRQPGAKGAASQSRSKSRAGVVVIGGLVLALILIGGAAMWSSSASGSAAASAAPQANSQPTANDMSRNEAAAKARAALGPHKQSQLPPLPVRGYAPPRPMETVRAAFQFAAEHPEVAAYVPCFCGCQNLGHRGNDECFVKTRAANGDVTQWEEHGIECAVCMDVATKSRQMYSSGASVAEIRAAVEKEFAHNFTSMTPTPKPPAKGN